MHPESDVDFCPTCGSEVDRHALTIMERNRRARDAQFNEIIGTLEQQQVDDRTEWSRTRFAAAAVIIVVVLGWMTWASATITILQAGR